MNTSELVSKSMDIIVHYYQNDIQPFVDVMHEEIDWYGPCEGQVIHSKKLLTQTFAQEDNPLIFETIDMKSSLLWKERDTCEILVTFLVDTFYPDNKVIRCDQRILLNWKEVRQTAEDGHCSVEPKIRTCFIANAIPMDGRDVIYPVHFTDMPDAKMFSITPAVKHLMIRGRDNSLLYLADNEVLHVKSMGHYTEIYCVNNIYESSEGISAIQEKYPDVFLRIHKSHLINPAFVQSVKRYEAVMTDGSSVPISTRKYAAIRRQITDQK